MGGKGRTTINQPAAPAPIDPGQSMGDYLFGKGFGKFKGITDPRLQERLIGAEETFRPRYAALELADINTFAFGSEAGMGSAQYKAKQAEIKALEKAKKKGTGNIDPATIAKNALGKRPSSRDRGYSGRGGSTRLKNAQKEYDKKYNALKKQFGKLKGSTDIDARIAVAKSELKSIGGRKAQGGLFDLLEEAGTRSAEMQRESLALQRADDVAALQEFAPQVVEAYRSADPFSTEMAELQSQQARDLYAESRGELSPERARLAEQSARSAGLARGRIGDSSSIAQELLGREQVRAGLRAEARQAGQMSFGQNRALAGDVGMTILGRPSSGLAMGSSVLGQAQGLAAGPMGPNLFDPNVGFNMAMQQRSQDMNLLGAQMQADATRAAGQSSARGSMIGGLLGAIIPG